MNSRFLFPVPGLLLYAGIVLIALAGCSTPHSLQIDVPQPVYFGNAPGSVLPLDTAHVQFVRQIFVETAHTAEKDKTVGGKSTTITMEGSEKIVGDASAQVEEAVGNDSLRFIGNGEIRARLEVYIPWTSFFTEFLGAIFIGNTTSEGLGEASSETIGISGTVYNVRRINR
jgi:hypothetical protein